MTVKIYWEKFQKYLLPTIVCGVLTALFVVVSMQPPAASATSQDAVIAAQCKKTTVVGHRGITAANVKNNTLAAFQLAVKSGAKVIELDIRRTKSEKGIAQWVVYHDDNIRGHKISNTTYTTLKKLEPTLTTYRQAMAYFNKVKTVRVLVEIKPSKISKGSAKYIGRVVNEYGMRGRMEIHSFHRKVLEKFRKYNSGFRTGFIMNKVKYSPATIRKFASSVIINKSLIFNRKVSVPAMKNAKLTVYAYTADSTSDWRSLVSYGVNGIMTDVAKNYLSWCSSIQPKPVVPPTPPVTPPAPPTPPVPATPPVDTAAAEQDDLSDADNSANVSDAADDITPDD